jgi:hypothetical protein
MVFSDDVLGKQRLCTWNKSKFMNTNYEFTVLMESYTVCTRRYLIHYVIQNLSIFKGLEVLQMIPDEYCKNMRALQE